MTLLAIECVPSGTTWDGRLGDVHNWHFLDRAFLRSQVTVKGVSVSTTSLATNNMCGPIILSLSFLANDSVITKGSVAELAAQHNEGFLELPFTRPDWESPSASSAAFQSLDLKLHRSVDVPTSFQSVVRGGVNMLLFESIILFLEIK